MATPSIIEASLNKILGQGETMSSPITAGTGGEDIIDVGQRAPISYISGLEDFEATPGTMATTTQAPTTAPAPTNPLTAAAPLPTPAPAPAPAPVPTVTYSQQLYNDLAKSGITGAQADNIVNSTLAGGGWTASTPYDTSNPQMNINPGK